MSSGSPALAFGAVKKTAESSRTPPSPARALLPTDQGSPLKQLHRSIHPLDLGRARGNEPARISQWHPGQYEILTNDEPRHQPARPETRPNQRLYVSLGSPPSVAVGSLSAPAAHRSRAPQIDKPRMNSIGTPVKVSRCEAAAVERSIAEIGLFDRLSRQSAESRRLPAAGLRDRWQVDIEHRKLRRGAHSLRMLLQVVPFGL
jgi:hypothetical protein